MEKSGPLAILGLLLFLSACDPAPRINAVIPADMPIPAPTVAEIPSNVTKAHEVEMVLVPEGEFTMGSEKGNESPIHSVFLDAYYIDKYEVTNSRYRACVDAGVCAPPLVEIFYSDSQYAQHPVNYVNWFKAKEYCEWRGDRLPTEAEWEKAARGTDERSYPWGEAIDDTFANYGQPNPGANGFTPAYGFTPVGSYPKGVSPYGAYDMAGNAWEWVADSFDGRYYESSPAFNPLGPPDGEYGTLPKVIRGGSWDNGASDLRTTKRIYECPDCLRNGGIGFRCARS